MERSQTIVGYWVCSFVLFQFLYSFAISFRSNLNKFSFFFWGRHRLQEYVNDMWNVIDFVTNSLYVATVALRVVSYFQVWIHTHKHTLLLFKWIQFFVSNFLNKMNRFHLWAFDEGSTAVILITFLVHLWKTFHLIHSQNLQVWVWVSLSSTSHEYEWKKFEIERFWNPNNVVQRSVSVFKDVFKSFSIQMQHANK